MERLDCKVGQKVFYGKREVTIVGFISGNSTSVLVEIPNFKGHRGSGEDVDEYDNPVTLSEEHNKYYVDCRDLILIEEADDIDITTKQFIEKGINRI